MKKLRQNSASFQTMAQTLNHLMVAGRPGGLRK